MASASGASGGGGGTSLNFKPVALAAHGVVAILMVASCNHVVNDLRCLSTHHTTIAIN